MKLTLLTLAASFAFTAVNLNAQGFGLRINEVLSDPAADEGTNTPGDANGDGTRGSASDDFIEIINYSDSPITMTGYQIWDSKIDGSGTTLRHTFADPTVLNSGEAIIVFGGGTLTGTYGGATAVLASTTTLNFSRTGEAAVLTDANRNVIDSLDMDQFNPNAGGAYGKAITRNPDMSGNFVLSDIPTNGHLQTPGVRIDSTAFNGTIPADTVNITGEADITQELGTLQLTATALPSFANTKTVTWGTTDATVATVDANGLVTAVANGPVRIFANADAGHGTDTVDITVSGQTTTGIEVYNQDFSIYPNPARDLIHVDFKLGNITKVNLSDLNGKLIKTIEVQNGTIDVSKLNQAVYHISFTYEGRNYTQRFIKE